MRFKVNNTLLRGRQVVPKIIAHWCNLGNVVIITIAFITMIGCDEGMNIARDVIGELDKTTNPVKPITGGEVKKP